LSANSRVADVGESNPTAEGQASLEQSRGYGGGLPREPFSCRRTCHGYPTAAGALRLCATFRSSRALRDRPGGPCGPGRRSEHLRIGAFLTTSDRHPRAVHLREAQSSVGIGGRPQSLLHRAVSAQEVRSGELARVLAWLRAETRYDVVHFDQFGVAPPLDAGRSFKLHVSKRGIVHLPTGQGSFTEPTVDRKRTALIEPKPLRRCSWFW
jgi:hypothetical protein